MQLAIQIDMLPGDTIAAQFERARELGIQGIEVWGQDAPFDAAELAEAAAQTSVKVSSIHHGNQGNVFDPHTLQREQALENLRESIVAAVDVGADGVVFVPNWYGLALPDLSPFKSAAQLQAEMLYYHLRTLSDYTYALGANLYLQPVNHYETDFITRLEQMAQITRKLKHPNVKIAADLYHMALEEPDVLAALRDHVDEIRHLHIADTNRGLPGQGMMDYAKVAETLQGMDYRGWVVLSCGKPGDNQADSAGMMRQLPACLDKLRQVGFV